jgi:hypothetical protein
MLEFRAAIVLGELFKDRGQGAELRPLLVSLLQSFTAGLDFPDVVRARTLLDELPV